MILPLPLSSDERLALRRVAHEHQVDLETAARVALRDWLIGNGYLEVKESDNDNEVERRDGRT